MPVGKYKNQPRRKRRFVTRRYQIGEDNYRIIRNPRMGAYTSMTNKANFVHNFKRRVTISRGVFTSVGVSGSGYLSGLCNPKLSDLPNVTDFTTLYDQYRINYVVYKIIWRSSSLSAIETDNATGDVGMPFMIWTIDRDSTSAVSADTAGYNALQEFANSKQVIFSTNRRTATIKFKPSTLAETYNNGITSGYTVQYNKWIDMENSSLVNLGARYIITTPSQNGTTNVWANFFDIEAVYYISCKNPK